MIAKGGLPDDSKDIGDNSISKKLKDFMLNIRENLNKSRSSSKPKEDDQDDISFSVKHYTDQDQDEEVNDVTQNQFDKTDLKNIEFDVSIHQSNHGSLRNRAATKKGRGNNSAR